MKIKGLLKKALAAATSAAMALSFVTAESVSADGGEYIYQKTVSVEQILADFQYFVQKDADITMHQVGTVYVGGTAQIGSFGDGAMVNSYVKDLACIVSTNFGAYLPDSLKKYKSETLYVGNTFDELNSNNNVPGWMYLYEPKYVTPTENEYVAADTFTKIIAASQSYAAAAQSSNVTISDNIITIDVTADKNATIPASAVGTDTKILFKGINSAEDFGKEAIIVSFIGINGDTFDLNSSNIFFGESETNLREGVRAWSDNIWEGDQKIGDVQILREGSYKLIWNFPDASGKITCGAFSGHIVAPLAHVSPDEGGAYTGNHEGGIIAKSVSAHNSEGHFYPFYPLAGNLPNPIVETTKNVVILKEFKVNGETADVDPDIYENTVFTLQDTDSTYTDILTACPARVTAADENGNAVVRFEVTFLSKGANDGKIQGGHNYIIKEEKSEGGFAKSGDVWYALVPEMGSSEPVKFSRELNGEYTADIPVFTNTKTTYDFSFTKTDGTDPLAGAEFTLYKGTDAAAVKTSAADGKVSFENIEAGGYTLMETSVPEGYEDNGTVYNVTVGADGVAITAPERDTTLSVTAGAYIIKNTKTPTPKPIELIKTYDEADFAKMTDSEISALLNGTEFTLYDGSTVIDTQKPIKDGSGGKVTFSTGIECNKLYKIAETAAPEGYDKSTAVWYAKVAEDGTVTYSATETGTFTEKVPTINNVLTETPPAPTPVAEDIILIKTYEEADFTAMSESEINALLNGTAFTLYDGADVIDTQKPVRDGSGGKVTFTKGIECNKLYKIAETAAPEGYDKSTAVWYAKVAEDGTVTYSATETGTFKATVPAINNVLTETPPAPTPAAGDIGLTNTYEGADFTAMSESEISALLNSTEFTLYDGTTVIDTQKPVKDGNGGKVTFTKGIECNKLYNIKETAAPEGYDKSTAVWYAKVAEDGTVTYSDSETGTYAADLPAIKNVPMETEMEFTKINSGTHIALEGAKFGLYTDSACENAVMRGGAQYTVQSDKDGIVRFDGLTAGTYYFKELTPPEGYEPNDKVYGVTISFAADGTGIVRFIDGENENLETLSVPNDPISGEIPPEPDNPEPDNPEPDNPEPDNPEPDNPEPDNPEPDNPEPDNPEPDNPEPDNPEPDNPEPDNPEPDNPEPDNPEPDNPNHSDDGRYSTPVLPYYGTPYLSKNDPASEADDSETSEDISSEAGFDEENGGAVNTDTAAYGAMILTMLASAAVIIAARKRRQK